MTCCDPICCGPVGIDDATTMAATMKALADPTRLRLFSIIASSGEQCACDLTEPLGVSQPTVSHHLRILTETGLVSREQRGKWVYFSVEPQRLGELRDFLDPAAVR